MFKTILIWQVSLHTENVKILKWYNQNVVYDKHKEYAKGENDWNSGEKTLLDSAIKSKGSSNPL